MKVICLGQNYMYTGTLLGYHNFQTQYQSPLAPMVMADPGQNVDTSEPKVVMGLVFKFDPAIWDTLNVIGQRKAWDVICHSHQYNCGSGHNENGALLMSIENKRNANTLG
jgi:hypothetical protein